MKLLGLEQTHEKREPLHKLPTRTMLVLNPCYDTGRHTPPPPRQSLRKTQTLGPKLRPLNEQLPFNKIPG